MLLRKALIALSVSAATLTVAAPAHAGPEAYIGEIFLVGYNFCPRGTVEAKGQLLSISEHTALFSLYGTMYGGDGRTTFALPDLRIKAAIKGSEASLKYCVVTKGTFPSRRNTQ